MFVSYAQNGEDIVLWRILQHVPNGTYVDVGAADPIDSSITKAFYDRGWCGINVEPTPTFAARLEQQRPRDQVFQCGASDRSGMAEFFVVEETGLSTLDASLVPLINDRGFAEQSIQVQLRPLNDILVEAGLRDRPIHFLKIDVEGAEATVLAGLDLATWRPWVLIIEATRPMSTEQNHEEWEAKVLNGGYTFCLFDGLNRYYVAHEHPELVPSASYPVCIFDFPYRSALLDENREAAAREAEAAVERVAKLQSELETREVYVREISERIHALMRSHDEMATDALRWRNESMHRRTEMLNANDSAKQTHIRLVEVTAHRDALQARSDLQGRQLSSVVNSLSWKLTKPLRVTRWMRRKLRERAGIVAQLGSDQPAHASVTAPRKLDGALVQRFCDRVSVVTASISTAQQPQTTLELALDAFRTAIEESSLSVMGKGWLAMVCVAGSYPTEETLENAARTYRRGGAEALAELMVSELRRVSTDTNVRESELEVVEGGVVVDVSHTAAHDLHTGIQRVVREFTSRWLDRPGVILVQWNFSTGSMKRLADAEVERLRNWRQYLHEPGSSLVTRALEEQSGKTLIPMGSVLVLPELVANPPTCSGYRSLARSGVVTRCSLIGYDSVPMTATETVTDGMTASFGHYLSLVKYSTHLAAISDAAATEFLAFEQMLRSQGLPGPAVTSRPLPTEAPELSAEDLEIARQDFHVGMQPVVVVVGSHEPRKNHLTVLEAAESMWRAGNKFDLVFAGGSSWGGSAFATYVQTLAAAGFPVRVYERVGERSLWGLYRLAQFSVFPSLLEGYGLPIAESLASGTPVVTSNHGSMAEIAQGGGAVLVDPRDPAQLASAMTKLLVDPDWRSSLAMQAAARRFPTWEDYAVALWADLVGDN